MCRRCGCLTRADTREPVRPVVIEGFVEPAVLLLLQHQESYGYELAQRLVQRRLASQAVPPARIYEVLRRLVVEGAVERRAEPGEQGPDRFRYTLTAAGERRLVRWATALRATAGSLQTFFTTYEAPHHVTAVPQKEEHTMGCQCQCCGGNDAGNDARDARVQQAQPRASAEARRRRELEARIDELETALHELRGELSHA